MDWRKTTHWWTDEKQHIDGLTKKTHIGGLKKKTHIGGLKKKTHIGGLKKKNILVDWRKKNILVDWRKKPTLVDWRKTLECIKILNRNILDVVFSTTILLYAANLSLHYFVSHNNLLTNVKSILHNFVGPQTKYESNIPYRGVFWSYIDTEWTSEIDSSWCYGLDKWLHIFYMSKHKSKWQQLGLGNIIFENSRLLPVQPFQTCDMNTGICCGIVEYIPILEMASGISLLKGRNKVGSTTEPYGTLRLVVLLSWLCCRRLGHQDQPYILDPRPKAWESYKFSSVCTYVRTYAMVFFDKLD